jgi:cytochrome c biogenesis protein CcmG/thiol:disulfide interchange protein DsbE
MPRPSHHPDRWRCIHLLGLALIVMVCWTAPKASAAVEVRPWSGDTPVLRFDAADGAPFDLRSLRGKVVVLNFWAAWCAPCREEIPHLQAWAAGQRGVQVVLVNIGDKPQVMRDWLQRAGVTLTSLRDPESRALAELGLRQLPATLILDAEGRIRWKMIGKVDEQAEPVRSKALALVKQ